MKIAIVLSYLLFASIGGGADARPFSPKKSVKSVDVSVSPKVKEDALVEVADTVPRGGVIGSRIDYVKWGDIGNLATAVLSFLLLKATPFNVDANSAGCMANPCKPTNYNGILDKCYVCDGFCISLPKSLDFNSHMLSLYADLALTVPLLLLRRYKLPALKSMGLDEYYLSEMKVMSVAGHGIAHLFLSIMTIGMPNFDFNTEKGLKRAVAALVFSRFFNRETLNFGKSILAKVQGENFRPAKTKGSKTFLRTKAAPVLAHVVLAIIQGADMDLGTVFQYAVFCFACYIFFDAGIPSGPHSSCFSIIMAMIVAAMASGQVNSVQQSFVVVFTSAYLVSSLYQVLFWKEKSDDPYPYAVTAIGSNLLTTLVGWSLGLFCTDLKEWGGHVLYDLSIPLSYFLIYRMCSKKMFPRRKA